MLRDKGGCELIHYLDNYLFVGAPGLGTCGKSLQLAERMCDKLTGVGQAGGSSAPASVPGYCGRFGTNGIETPR